MIGRRSVILGMGAGAVGGALAASSVASAQEAPAAGSTLDTVLASNKLRISTIVGAEPYFRKSAVDDTWSGAGIEMGKSIAEALGVELEYVETTYANAIIELKSGRIDIAFSLNPTPARALSIGFTNPYYNHPYVFLAKEGFTGKTWADINREDARVTASAGTLPDTLVRRYAPKAQLVTTKTIDEGVLAVQTGRADAIITAALQGLAIKAKNPLFSQVVVPAAPRIALPTCLGVRPEIDPRWVNFLNSWIAMNRATGQIMEWIAVELEKGGISRDEIPQDA
jgi:polar amino acid transport system substrate-binding protein